MKKQTDLLVLITFVVLTIGAWIYGLRTLSKPAELQIATIACAISIVVQIIFYAVFKEKQKRYKVVPTVYGDTFTDPYKYKIVDTLRNTAVGYFLAHSQAIKEVERLNNNG